MNKEFADFLKQAVRLLAIEIPEIPTHMGVFEIEGEPVPRDRFTDMGADSRQARRQTLNHLAATLVTFPLDSLTEDERISAAVLEYLLDYGYERGLVGRAGQDLADHDYPVRPAVGPQSELPMFLAELHPMRFSEDAEAYVARLSCIAPQLSEAGYQLVDGRRRGLTPPAPVIADTIEEIENFLSTDPRENVLIQTLERKTRAMPHLGEFQRRKLIEKAEQEVLTRIYPAYDELANTLRGLHGDAPEGPGLWCLPNGTDWYGFLLKSSTTTSLSAEEIHDLGLQEMALLQTCILGECRATGVEANDMGSVNSALASVKTKHIEDTPENREAIVTMVRELVAQAQAQMAGLFHQLPRGRIEVRPIARFAEKQRNQMYQPPSLDGSRPGLFELNVGQLLGHGLAELPTLVHHEIFPGHHLQIALALENTRLPLLRRFMNTDAYIEGWAKYAETIPERHGVIDDPKFRLGRMQRELISTVNLALDTGIHAKRWDEDKATEFCQKNTGCNEQFARHLVHRSAAVPAQMCSYKIGMMTMEKLRRKFEQQLGSNFDVRDFHSAVLDCGSVPLELLEKIVDSAIERLRPERNVV